MEWISRKDHAIEGNFISFLCAFRVMSSKVNVSLIMWNQMKVKNFFPRHVIVHSAKSAIWESRSVRWRCLKPHLEVSLQNSNLKAFPTEDLDGFFHEINFQSFQLGCGGNCQDIDLFQVDNHSTSARIT